MKRGKLYVLQECVEECDNLERASSLLKLCEVQLDQDLKVCAINYSANTFRKWSFNSLSEKQSIFTTFVKS